MIEVVRKMRREDIGGENSLVNCKGEIVAKVRGW
jgi:hypothetical protein